MKVGIISTSKNKFINKFKIEKSTIIGTQNPMYKILDYYSNTTICHFDFLNNQINNLYFFSGCQIDIVQEIINYLKSCRITGD